MKRAIIHSFWVILLSVILIPFLDAATKPPCGRVSLYPHAASSTYDQGGKTFCGDLVLTLTLRSADTGKGGLEYRLDVRTADY